MPFFSPRDSFHAWVQHFHDNRDIQPVTRQWCVDRLAERDVTCDVGFSRLPTDPVFNIARALCVMNKDGDSLHPDLRRRVLEVMTRRPRTAAMGWQHCEGLTLDEQKFLRAAFYSRDRGESRPLFPRIEEEIKTRVWEPRTRDDDIDRGALRRG